MKKIPVELRQLEYFQMAARLKNLTRAAERLHVSQPNITVAIKKLESSLGIQLFDRSQKQLSLTPEGSVFLSRVDVALRNVQDALIEIDDYKQLQKGTIRIGIPPMIGSFLFPRIYCDFRRQHPNLAINLFEEGSKKAREKLEDCELLIETYFGSIRKKTDAESLSGPAVGCVARGRESPMDRRRR